MFWRFVVLWAIFVALIFGVLVLLDPLHQVCA